MGLMRIWVVIFSLVGAWVALWLEKEIRHEERMRDKKKQEQNPEPYQFPNRNPHQPTNSTLDPLLPLPMDCYPQSAPTRPPAEVNETEQNTDAPADFQKVSMANIGDTAAQIQRTIERIEAEHSQPPFQLEDRSTQVSFGPPDGRPHGNARRILQSVAGSQLAAQRLGKPLHIRPAFAESVQSFYLGSEPQRDNQELHHAVFLNAGLQIHDPSVGFPGFRTGHIYAQMLTPRLHDQPPVKFDVPGVRRQEVARYLKKNQNELRQRADDVSIFHSSDSTRLTGTQNKSMNDERSMPKVISTDTSLQAIGVPVPFTFKAPFPTSPAALFLTHPIHQPPPCDTTDMHAVGLTAD
jgi:hypothetical protein